MDKPIKEPQVFLEIGSVFVNGSCYLRDFADNLDRLEELGNADLGNSKGFKKARKLAKKARKWADKIDSTHISSQKEAESLGYDIQTGAAFESSCKESGLILLAGDRR